MMRVRIADGCGVRTGRGRGRYRHPVTHDGGSLMGCINRIILRGRRCGHHYIRPHSRLGLLT